MTAKALAGAGFVLFAVVGLLLIWWVADRGHADFQSAAAERPAAIDVRIAMSASTFSQTQDRPVVAVDADTNQPLTAPVKCRWIARHSDIGLTLRSANGCEATFFVDPVRTRLVRFEFDAWMGIDVVASMDGRRVGFASSRIQYQP